MQIEADTIADTDNKADSSCSLDPNEARVRSLQSLALDWYQHHARHFPWRNTHNPFHILIAEVLLRQTQAKRVADPYLELISIYPDPGTLAEADPDKLRLWFKPLGLVRRADYLINASKQIRDRLDGQVPRDLDSLTKLSGIGTYAARAILCMGFGDPVPMVDESSGRLLRRLLGLRSLGPAYSDRQLIEIATLLIPKDRSKEFNLCLLDIAAAFCRTKNPSCSLCPLVEICAYASSNRKTNKDSDSFAGPVILVH